MSEVKTEIKELAAKVKGSIKIDGKSVDIPKTFLVDNFSKEEVETIKGGQKLTAEIVAATSLAFGEQATEVMKKNKDVDVLSASTMIGADKLELSFQREATFPDTKNPGKKITKQGFLQPKYRSFAGKGASGQLSKVRAQLQDQFADLVK